MAPISMLTIGVQPPTLVVRFLLNLRRPNEALKWSPSSNERHSSCVFIPNSSPNFSNVHGNIGQPLDHEQAERYTHGEEETDEVV